MSFLGPVTTLPGQLIRPHDIELRETDDRAGAVRGVVTRMVRVGFEVLLTVRTDSNPDRQVVLTRAEARASSLDVGTEVWCVPARGAQTVPSMKSSVRLRKVTVAG